MVVDPQIAHITEEEMIAKLSDPQKLVVIFLMSREGVTGAISEIEDHLFPPGTPANAELDLYLKQWPAAEPLMWGIITMPRIRQAEVEQILDRHKLRLANGIPTVISGGRVRTFPIHGEHIRMLEHNQAWHEERAQQRRGR